MINQLRTESCSGAIQDLAHVSTHDCLADCLTKNTAKADALVKAVDTGRLPNVDKNPPFREMMKHKHKAYWTQDDYKREDRLNSWMTHHIKNITRVETLLGFDVKESLSLYLSYF